ncbi:DUF1653 domain-containing protein [Patescibacteria group bacterium]|nr:DUF1653 domain-containing protein [Patescibacteria group bacterium]
MKRIVLTIKEEEFRHAGYSFFGVALHAETLEEIKVWRSNDDFENEISALPPGKYRHFKGGEYLFVGTSYYSGTREDLIIYKSLYDSEEYPKGTLLARSVGDFLGTKETPDGIVSRFEYIGE